MFEQPAQHVQPVIVPRSDHRISRSQISDNALKVLYRLKNGGYEAYLVGGGVRDLSLGREPKDFDIATDATPEQVNELFRNCRLIGRRFRLAHVHFGREIIEVATFRALNNGGEEDSDGDHVTEDGLVLRDNVYGTIEEDALRRDFTVNALYYNIADFSIVDYAGGMADLEAAVIRLIGDPEVRFREDPVRMLRAVRFAVKLGFRIDPDVAEAMPRLAPLLADIPAARLFEEVLKLFMGGQGEGTFELLRRFGLYRYLFPATDTLLDEAGDDVAVRFIARALANTDLRIMEERPVTPAFLFAAMLWPVVVERAAEWQDDVDSDGQALQQASAAVVQEQVAVVTIPKRFGVPMREIWSLQPRFEKRSGKRAQRLLGHPRFRAAYDFLLLRAEVGDADPELANWWTEFQDADPERRRAMTGASGGGGKRGRRGRRGRRGDDGDNDGDDEE
ncbi:polynucleotide adenylyltransferase PcnB [Arhodomonas aquaeolei]|uniref:polynucleotide adenylyltransferase PcnB n=1 Tax=Arhodomonas aquaeolei TaxID=2369 RepID=UPI00035E60E6|nr:polynucleotide adenylyltransferase PcnB [Arhodomonas aquaeolei]